EIQPAARPRCRTGRARALHRAATRLRGEEPLPPPARAAARLERIHYGPGRVAQRPPEPQPQQQHRREREQLTMVNLNDIPLDHVDPNQAFDPLPTAWYAMRAVASEQKPTKAGDGAYLQYELEIDENHHPELKGRKVWDRFNLWNPNSQAVEIAQRQLKA